jgi:hypothetical protein
MITILDCGFKDKKHYTNWFQVSGVGCQDYKMQWLTPDT